MYRYVWSLVCWYLRPIIKWFLRQTTSMCELQRICYGEPSGAKRTLAVENSLYQSRNPEIKALVITLDELTERRGFNAKTERKVLEDAIRTVLLAKKINPVAHPDFAKTFGKCVELIWGYRQLVFEIEELRKTGYDSSNPEHEVILLKLWNLLKPDEPLEARVTKQWQDIGFQMYRYVWSLVCWYLRPIIKWFLRQTTSMCELQRICYGEPSGAKRTLAVENSLYQSRNPEIKALVITLDELTERRGFNAKTERKVLEDAIRTVLLAKKINPVAHPDFAKTFGKCVELIWGYRQLVFEIEELRKTGYDSSNPEHEVILLKLWNLLKPDEPLEARNLVFFADEYPIAARHALLHSVHPRYGYAFAIVGINITSMAWRLLRDGAAKTHVYNSSKTLPGVRAFHQFFSYLFYAFDEFWIESKPTNMMEFSSISQKFENSIRTALANPATVFRLNPSLDKI
ncbi:Similar to Elmod1: ELMO domain-containing protein 1 (Mus musculus) [Cotesia congregata]|uniref:Similar to Elmod1: ELMO domain-containing protein 1 (Mus musculus) n=1 Tax=Cotesia congregata TaxID=51543 RepID=A0A8J2EE37_COTCN|nr:Similar to Elmod1: ELMO domain-containing protein 1 (Mus musculus) [Cotesia congregata]